MITDHSNNSVEQAIKGRVSAEAKMETMIRQARSYAAKSFDDIMGREWTDALVPSSKLVTNVNAGQLTLSAPKLQEKPLTNHAVGQLAQMVGFNAGAIRNLVNDPNPINKALAAEVLNTLITTRLDDAPVLYRGDQDNACAVLSANYKRLDTRPILAGFGETCAARGMLPLEGFRTDTHNRFRMVMPTIIYPLENEPMLFGLDFGNSEVGAGRLNVNVWLMRLWCTNTATVEDTLHTYTKVHRGARMTHDRWMASETTYELQERLALSEVSDMIDGALSPKALQSYTDLIVRADAAQIDTGKALKHFVGKGTLTKSEAEALEPVLVSTDVHVMPSTARNTRYALSNAISWLGGQQQSDARRLHLQGLAGDVLAA